MGYHAYGETPRPLCAGLDEEWMVSHPVISKVLREALQALHAAILRFRSEDTNESATP